MSHNGHKYRPLKSISGDTIVTVFVKVIDILYNKCIKSTTHNDDVILELVYRKHKCLGNRDIQRWGIEMNCCPVPSSSHRRILLFYMSVDPKQSCLLRGHVNNKTFQKYFGSGWEVQVTNWKYKKIGKHIFIHYFVTFLGEHSNVNNMINAYAFLV